MLFHHFFGFLQNVICISQPKVDGDQLGLWLFVACCELMWYYEKCLWWMEFFWGEW
jgi:hypothetical protein